jgi:hypothetical protein
MKIELTQSNITEKVASEIHVIWMTWAKELLENENDISEERKERWETECFKPYAELSSQMKDLDRKFAKKILRIVKK